MELHNSGPSTVGDADSNELQSSDPGAAPATRGAARVLTADAAGVVVLPAGTELGDIRVEGRDLVVIGEDGVRYIIPDGAIIVPQIVIDDVSIPPLNLAALLVGNEPQPAAGNPQSSGGNFASAVGPIQAAYGLGDLLPYTELNFAQPEEQEIIPQLIDREPTISIITIDQPVGAQAATATVAESGLPPRGGEPAGTNSSAPSETTTGTIVFSSPDGIASIMINGTTFTGVGQTISSPRGSLLITSYDPGSGTIGFSYTLTDNLLGGTLADTFEVTIRDPDGDVATATLTVSALDDAPIARNDTDSVVAGSYASESGNVITAVGTTSGPVGADTPGADGASVSRIASNGVPANTDTTFDVAGNLQVAGQYGTLLIKADGSYVYTRGAGTPGGVSDAFTYTLTDGDGSTSTATLTISIGDATPVITSVPPAGDFDAGTLVYESGLPPRTGEAPGTNAPAPTETTSGTVTFSGGDGPVTATINGVAVVPGATVAIPGVGTLTVDTFNPMTGALTYTFTLADNTTGDNTSATFNVIVTDVDGDSAPGTFVIAIQDDSPQAIDDMVTQAVENAPVSVNVFANDIQGADSVQASTVTLVAGTLSGTGVLVNNGDGTFTYTPGPGENGPVTFDYSITDGDSDSSTATVTIALITDSTPRVGRAADLSVDEDGFANANLDSNPLQSNPSEVSGSASLSDTGSVTVNFGGDVPANLSASIVLLDSATYDTQLKTLDGNPVTFAIESGVLIGRDSGGAEVIRVTVTGASLGTNPGDVVYTYTTLLSQPVQHATTGSEDSISLTGITFQVIDLDGDPATGSFSVAILDDVPTAVNDGPFGVVEDGSSSISGNVLTNDLSGADTPKVFSQWSAANAAEVAELNVYGTLTLNADGSWSFVLDNSRAATQALTAADLKTYTLDYTMADADGDPSPATLTITITGADDTATVVTAQAVGPDNTVYEAGLNPDGSAAAGTSETDTGSFTVSASDGIATVTIGGQAFTLAQVQAFATTNGVVDTGEGTLTLTGYTGSATSGTVSYSYTLKATIDNDSKAGATGTAFDDSITIAVAGVGGTSGSDDLVVRIVDDVPTAVNDGPFGVVEDGSSSISGNVLTNDLSGADTPKVFSQWSAANAAEVAELNVYGTLTLNADGSWSFVLDNSRAATQALTAADLKTYTLDYTMADADGDPSPATLTITITGADDTATVVTAQAVGPDNTVYEAGLNPDGSAAAGTSETDTGSFTVSASDGIATVTIGGQAFTLAQVQAFATTNGVVDTGEGTLTLTGYTGSATSGTVSYSYTLKATIDNDSKAGATGTAFDDSITIAVAGVGGTSGSDDLVVRIVDDVPTAVNDGPFGVVEDGSSSISGNVLTNDLSGADTPKVFSQWSAANAAEVAELNVYGTLTLNADGSWSFVLDNSRAATQALTAADLKTYTLDYTMADADGDPSPATLTITITGADDTATVVTAQAVGPDNTVYEAGLNPDGSAAAGTSETDTGSFTVSASDGIATVTIGGQAFTLAQVQAFATTNGVVDTGEGTLTLTGYTGSATSGTVSYSYTLKATIDNDSKAGATGTAFDDSITIAVAGVGGTSGSDDLVVRIVDDVPTAVNDGPFGVVEDGSSSISGNVLTNDLSGADTPKVFSQWSAANAAEVAELNVYGTLTLNADGSWSFVLDNSRAATQALTAADLKTYTLDYTMADADGDPSPATLTITITGADDTATVVTAQAVGPDNTVYEAGLNPDGSAAAGTSETDTGSFTVSASDGIATVTIGGQAFTLAQVQAFATTNGVVDTGEGTLTLTGYTGSATSGTVSYSYTLKATIDNDSKAGATGTAFDDSITIAVAGVGGTSGSDDLVVRIVDDVPTAVNDGPFGVVEDGSSSISGNVLTNDLSGADTPKVFSQWSAANAAEVAELNVYGTLTLNADGSWSFVLDNSRAATQALTAADLKTYTLDYTMADADGDPSPATLTITITGADDTATVVTAQAVGPDNTVYEAGLNPDGSAAAGTSETDTGSFTVSASDGIATVTIGGQAFTLAQVQAFATTNGVVDTGEGTLTLTGYTGSATSGTVSYSYTLKATIDNDSKAGATGTAFDDSITIAVAGVGGTSGSDDLVVRIVDDVPTAVNDGPFGVVEDGSSSISGNVLTNDVSGADTPKVFSQWSAANAAEVAELNVYGTLTLNADGSWSFVLDNSRAATQALTAADLKTYTLDYTMADADGDPSPATLTITITGADDTATVVTAQAVGPDNTVYEAGLNPDGSAAAGTSETDTGSFTVSASDGIATVTIGGQAFTLAQVQAFATTNGVVDTGEGTLTLTGYTGSATSGTVSYSYTLKATIDNDSKAGATGTAFDDSITIAVAGVGGTSGSDDLVVRIVDDVPTAVLDTAMVTEGGTVAKTTLITGVLGNDKSGADLYATAGAVDGVRASGGDITTPVTGGVGLGTPISGLHGTLTLYSDGTYSYKANADAISTNAQDVFVYTIKDGDGDTSTTTLTIDITAVTLTPDNQSKQVDEAALDITTSGADLGHGTVSGTNPSLTTETVTGTLNVTGSTGITYVAQNIVTTYGLFKLNTDGTYTYTLTKPYTTTPAANDGAVVPTGGFETLGYTAMDANGNTVGGTVTITIKDDVPTAVVAAMASGNNATGTTFNANLDAGTGDGDIDNNYGADGGKAIFTAASIASLQSQNLSSGLSSLNYTISADGTVLTATKVGDASLVFTITLDPVSADDKYVVSINQPLDSISNVDFTGNAYQFVGGNTAWAGFVPTGEPVTGTDNNSKDLLLTPAVGGANASTINQSSVQYGVGSGNSIGLGTSNNPATAETFRLDFVTDLRGNSAGAGGYGDPTNQDHLFDGHYQTNGASVFFTASNGTTLKFAAFDDYDGNTAVGDGVLDAITGVALSYRGFTTGVIIPTTTTQTFTIGPVGDQHTYTITANGDGTVNVGGLYGTSGAQANGTSVAIYTDTTGPLAPGETLAGYNSLQFTYVSGDEIKVGNFGATIITNEPVGFTVPFSLQDGDGDITPSGNLSVTLNPVVPPIALDLDGNGVEFTSLEAGTTFDYGSGLVQSAWVGGNDGLLAIDLNGDGKVSGQELAFGGGDMTDLEGLAARYDTNHDGVLDASDADFAKFGVWQDANGDGVSDAGEFRTLTEAGIVSISLKSDGVGYTAAGGDVTVFGSSTFTRADGTTGVVADAAFATQARSEQRTAEIVAMAALAGAVVDAVPVAAQPALPVEENSQALPTLQPVAVQSELDTNAGDATSKSPAVVPNPAAHAVDEPGDSTAHFAGETTDARMIANDTAFDHVSDASAWLAADAGPSSAGASVGLFAAMATDGTMQALLSIAPQAKVIDVGPDGEVMAKVDSALSDFTGEAIVDGIVEHFAAGQADTNATAAATVANDVGHFMLAQDIGGSAGFAGMIHLPDAHDDASMLAAAQA